MVAVAAGAVICLVLALVAAVISVITLVVGKLQPLLAWGLLALSVGVVALCWDRVIT